MDTKIIERLQKNIENLYELDSINGMIESLIFPTGKTSQKEIEVFEKSTQKKLPYNLKEFYSKIGLFSIEWKYKNPKNSNHIIYGRSLIFKLSQMLKHPDSRINLSNKPGYEWLLWNEGDDLELIERLQEMYLFDELLYDNYILFKITDNDEPELYLYTRPDNLSKLKLTILQYIDLTLKTKGMYLWQQYFTEKTTMPMLLPDNFHYNMQHLFPETDVSEVPHADRPYYEYKINVLKSKANFVERLEHMVNELKSHKKITNVEFRLNRLNPGAHPADIHRSFLALGFELPNNVLKFFQNINGLSLKWNSVEKDGLECDFTLLSLEEMFAGLDPGGLDWVLRRKWNFNAAKYYGKFGGFEGDIAQLESWRILYMEERENTLIKFNADGSVWLLLMEDFNQYKLTLEFDEFIERLFEYKGIKYWQSLFTDRDPYKKLGLPRDYMEKFHKLFHK